MADWAAQSGDLRLLWVTLCRLLLGSGGRRELGKFALRGEEQPVVLSLTLLLLTLLLAAAMCPRRRAKARSLVVVFTRQARADLAASYRSLWWTKLVQELFGPLPPARAWLVVPGGRTVHVRGRSAEDCEWTWLARRGAAISSRLYEE